MFQRVIRSAVSFERVWIFVPALTQDVKKLKTNGRWPTRAGVPRDAVWGAVGAHTVRGGRNVAFGSVSLAPAPLSVMKGLLSDVCRLGGEGRTPQTEKSWGLALNRFPWSRGSSQQ